MGAIPLVEPPTGVKLNEPHELEHLTYDLKMHLMSPYKTEQKPDFDAQKHPDGPRSLCTVPKCSDVTPTLTYDPRTSLSVPYDSYKSLKPPVKLTECPQIPAKTH